jgi:hypothetical protein
VAFAAPNDTLCVPGEAVRNLGGGGKSRAGEGCGSKIRNCGSSQSCTPCRISPRNGRSSYCRPRWAQRFPIMISHLSLFRAPHLSFSQCRREGSGAHSSAHDRYGMAVGRGALQANKWRSVPAMSFRTYRLGRRIQQQTISKVPSVGQAHPAQTNFLNSVLSVEKRTRAYDPAPCMASESVRFSAGTRPRQTGRANRTETST